MLLRSVLKLVRHKDTEKAVLFAPEPRATKEPTF